MRTAFCMVHATRQERRKETVGEGNKRGSKLYDLLTRGRVRAHASARPVQGSYLSAGLGDVEDSVGYR